MAWKDAAGTEGGGGGRSHGRLGSGSGAGAYRNWAGDSLPGRSAAACGPETTQAASASPAAAPPHTRHASRRTVGVGINTAARERDSDT